MAASSGGGAAPCSTGVVPGSLPPRRMTQSGLRLADNGGMAAAWSPMGSDAGWLARMASTAIFRLLSVPFLKPVQAGQARGQLALTPGFPSVALRRWRPS